MPTKPAPPILTDAERAALQNIARFSYDEGDVQLVARKLRQLAGLEPSK